MNIYLIVFITLIAALFTSFSQLLFKRGLSKRLDTVAQILGTLGNRYVFLGLCGYLASFLLYLVVLRVSELSVVFPIFASSFIFVTLISAYMLKERVGIIRIAGIVLIFFGIAIVAFTA